MFFCPEFGQKMGWKISFLLLALIAKSLKRFYADTINCGTLKEMLDNGESKKVGSGRATAYVKKLTT